ncbi:MAG: hypothetical protein PF517_10675 [Salinivirgaceae bacterium]|jgi:hypothetical protein|nr:hypothetical protein [Salinivirgaceae bacterium]
MKMKLILLIVSFLLVYQTASAQKKDIKVQIIHEDKVVLDTTFHETSAEAKLIIENLVQQFTTDPVSIDSKLTHGLYVFNINNDNWKEPDKIEATEKSASKTYIKVDADKISAEENTIINTYDISTSNSNSDEVDMDSLFKEFSGELDENWDEVNIDIVIDSIGSSFQNLWSEIKKTNLLSDPDVEEFKSDFKGFFEDFKSTKFIIIHDGDTVDFD